MDGPLNKVVGKWTDTEYRDPIYVNSLKPEIDTDDRFGTPHENYECIRVAGTNGKGSTVRMIAWSLQEEGYDVGLMSNVSTTKTLTDTIKYNGGKISKIGIKDLCEEVHSVAHKDIEPYGIRTIAALEWFRQKEVDVAVLESGVGSRYDATNIVDSDVYVITNVGEDHVESFEGNENAIIRDFALGGVGSDSVVTNAETKEAEKIKRISEGNVSVASERSTLYGPNPDLSYDCELDGSVFETTIRSDYQEENLNTCLEALDQCSLNVSLESIKSMLSSFKFEGRAELIKDKPDILLDGAHNMDGILALKSTLKETSKESTIVFTALEDKPWKQMLDELSSKSNKIILTSPQGGKRDGNDSKLRERSEMYISDPQRAIQKAKSKTDKTGLVVVTGSLYMIREVRNHLT